MKKTILFLSIFLLTIVFSQESKAYEFMSNGICYYILSNNDKTVSVTCQYTKNNKGGGSVPTGYYTYWYNELIGYDEDDDEIYQSYQYWFTSDYSGDVIIPSSVVYNSQTYQVTRISSNAFNNISINSLTIPSSITKIDEDVFRNFKGALVINCNTFAFEGYDDGEYTYYPYSAYWGGGSQISSVSFGNTVTSITSNAFSGCTGLKTVTIPSSVTSIGSSAFSGCSSLATVTFMGSVSTIGSSAFPTSAIMLVPNGKKSEYVAKLGASYKVYEVDEQFDIDGLLYKIDFSTKTASIVGFSDDTSITIPETITVDGVVYPVTAIDEYGLSRKNGSNSENSITEINIPSSIKSIGASAFIYCNSLTRVDITDLEAWCDINFDGEDANPLSKAHNLYLNGVKIDDLVIPNSVENLKKDVFAGGHFSSVSIPSTTNLKWYGGNGQFERASIGSITIVQDISDAAFFHATIDHLIIAPSVTYGGYQSFNSAQIGKLEIPYSETALTYSNGNNSYGLFEAANIDVAVVDRNMYSSYYYSSKKPPFYISTITNLHVGSHIASEAYKQCTLVNVFTKETTPVTIYANTFSNRSIALLYVPEGCKSAYQSATYWQDFKEIIEIPGSTPAITFADANVKAICVAKWDLNDDGELNEGEAALVRNLNYAFSQNTEIVSFDEFRYFTGLQTFDSFWNCTNLQSITIPKSITYIDSGNKFNGCVNLSSLKVDEDNTVYDSRNNCNAIIKTETNTLVMGCKSTIIPNDIIGIGYRAFCNSGINSVTIPSNVTSIGYGAFLDCSGLTSVTVDIITPLTIADETFSNRANATLYVPYGSSAAYEAADYWKEFKEIVEMDREELVVSLDVDRYVGMGYNPTHAVVDFTEAKEFLGVDEITTDMLSFVNPDGTTISYADYMAADYDGWCNAEGAAEKHVMGGNSKICVKFFQAVPDGEYSICHMNGADIAGETYTVKWALEANNKIVTYNVNITFIEEDISDIVTTGTIETSVSYDPETESYTEKVIELTNAQKDEICDILSLDDIADGIICGYNPSTKKYISYYGEYDGWRNADGDFTMHTGTTTAPACVKFVDGQLVCYNIQGCDPQTINCYWAIVNADKEAVLIKTAFIYANDDENNTLYAEDASVNRGAEYNLPVQLDNGEEEITAFVFDVELPEGVTLLSAKLSERKVDHTNPVPTLQGDGSYRLASLSGSNSPFSGSEGTLLTLKIKVSPEASLGNKTITLKNIEITTSSKAIELADRTSTLTILDILTGDANGDGKVSIFDAVQIVNYILGNNPTPFIESAADVDGNGKITIFDAVSTVNIILNQSSVSNIKKMKVDELDPQ